MKAEGTNTLRRLVASLVVVVVSALGIIYALVPPKAPPPAAIPTPKLRVAGQDLADGGDPVGRALDVVRKYAMGEVTLRLPGERAVKLTRADFGLEIDRVRLSRFVNEALAPGSAIARARAARDGGAEPIDVPLPIALDPTRALAKLADLKTTVDAPPHDATVDLEKRVVRPEQIGHELDVYGTLAAIEDAFRAGKTEVAAVVIDVPPKRTQAELKGVVFDSVLGFFETRYTRGQKYADREFNLHLAASRLDGTVLMPGEEFDFNARVGPRDEAHGYRVAKVIAEGELVDGIGGGTCQISGTLYAAALLAGLEIVERYRHSRPSAYIKLGLDATVSYPDITFRFKNPFDFPVVLHEKVSGGVVRAEILGPERKLTVSYFRRIDEILPFEEMERESPKLPAGKKVVVQRGIPGFRATASRVVRDGAYAERTKWSERYPPTTQIVAVGTGPEDLEPKVTADNHPEYVADEYLVITQGPGVKGEGGMREDRTPGRTGEEGWIKKLGFEKTPIEPEADEKDKDKSDKDKSPKSETDDKKKDEKKKDDKDKKKDKKKKKKSEKGKT